MREGRAGQETAARRALNEALLQKERLDDLLDGVAGFAERSCDRLDPDRPAAESFGDQFQIAAIECIEAALVDLEPCQRFIRGGGVDTRTAGDGSKVPQSLEESSRNAGR